MCKCSYLRYTLGYVFLVTCFNIIRATRETIIRETKKKKVQKKAPEKLAKNVHRRKLCEEHHFFGCTSSFLCNFLSLFSSTPSLLSTILRKKNFLFKKMVREGGPSAHLRTQCLRSCVRGLVNHENITRFSYKTMLKGSFSHFFNRYNSYVTCYSSCKALFH